MTAGHLGIPAPNQAALEELSAEAAYLDRAGQRPCGAVGQAIADRTFRVPAQQLAAAKAEAGGGQPRPRPWPRTCTEPGSVSSPTATRLGALRDR
jgi:hypothetical protein